MRGLPECFLTERYTTDLEDDFTVVVGVGAARRRPVIQPSDTSRGVTLEQLIADTVAVTNYLRERFGREQIYLMGHPSARSLVRKPPPGSHTNKGLYVGAEGGPCQSTSCVAPPRLGQHLTRVQAWSGADAGPTAGQRTSGDGVPSISCNTCWPLRGWLGWLGWLGCSAGPSVWVRTRHRTGWVASRDAWRRSDGARNRRLQ